MEQGINYQSINWNNFFQLFLNYHLHKFDVVKRWWKWLLIWLVQSILYYHRFNYEEFVLYPYKVCGLFLEIIHSYCCEFWATTLTTIFYRITFFVLLLPINYTSDHPLMVKLIIEELVLSFSWSLIRTLCSYISTRYHNKKKWIIIVDSFFTANHL